jgi:type I restriction enzyme M protein
MVRIKSNKIVYDLTKPEVIQRGQEKGYITIKENRIYYNASGKNYNFKDPEEKVRAQAYVELIEKYKYPDRRIEPEIYPPRREPKLPADLVVYQKEKDRCFIVVEIKDEETEKEIQIAKREGLGNATLLDAKYLWIVCGSERFAYDVYEKPSLAELEKNRIADIPIAYGREPKFKFKKGDPQLDLRDVSFNELEAKFQICHDEIWEGGKRDPAIAFDEMSKLMFAKIFDERFTKNGEYYKFQIGTHEEKRDVAERIKNIYKDAQHKEPDVFKGEIELPDRLIFRLVEILQDISFSKTDLDAKGRAFEKFLTKIFRGEYGQYFTRREIVEFMVDMLDPGKDDLLIDPACGSGGFLLYTIDKVRKKAERDYAGDKRTIEEIYFHFPRDSVFGIEINDRIARIAMMDMVIHDDGHTNIENNDALRETKNFHPKRDIKLGKYTLLLTNPPFGAIVKDEEILKKYELGSRVKKRKSQRTEILFIERCLEFLRPQGRMGIVLPDGVLTNSSLQYVRDFIERKAKILAVISLPQTAFVPAGAGVKASLVFLQKKRFDDENIGNYPIFMAIADKIGYDAAGRPDKNELPDIVKDYGEFLKGKKSF